MLHRVLDSSGLDPHRLTLELTETALMSDAAAAADVLGQAGALGIRTAIDDFGAGYWSMAHLRRLPMHVLKIDQSITADVATDPTSRALAHAIITMGHALGASIVAEGIETAEQAATLTALDCDAGQGYWIARPQPGGTPPVLAAPDGPATVSLTAP
jgi:EAL domain-containing protein (putative c-di-GMP-specific phosphodiesterase class I)